MKGRLAMLLQKILQYMLSECPICRKPLAFEPWETSTVCECGTYIWLHPEIDRQLAPVLLTAGAFRRPAGPAR